MKMFKPGDERKGMFFDFFVEGVKFSYVNSIPELTNCPHRLTDLGGSKRKHGYGNQTSLFFRKTWNRVCLFVCCCCVAWLDSVQAMQHISLVTDVGSVARTKIY